MKRKEESKSPSMAYGPVFCLECGLFFDDKTQNILNYHNCKGHRKITTAGYKLVSRLEEEYG